MAGVLQSRGVVVERPDLRPVVGDGSGARLKVADEPARVADLLG